MIFFNNLLDTNPALLPLFAFRDIPNYRESAKYRAHSANAMGAVDNAMHPPKLAGNQPHRRAQIAPGTCTARSLANHDPPLSPMSLHRGYARPLSEFPPPAPARSTNLGNLEVLVPTLEARGCVVVQCLVLYCLEPHSTTQTRGARAVTVAPILGG